MGRQRPLFHGAAIVLSALLLGSSSAQQPTDPATLVERMGQRVRGFIFAPLDHAGAVLPLNGKPTVIVVFASWCAACLSEMPTIIADAGAFGGAVNILGIDYDEGAANARAFIETARIPFSTESFDHDAPMGADKSHPFVVHVPGGRLTPDALDAFKDAVPAQTYEALVQLARAQQSRRSDVDALEQHLGVYVEDVGTLPNEAGNSLTLPHAFVVDGSGILRDDIVGYEPGKDRIRAALERLGVRHNVKR